MPWRWHTLTLNMSIWPQIHATNVSGALLFALKLSSSNVSATYTVQLHPDQISTAKAMSLAPVQASVEERVRVSVSLSSFSMVYTPDEVAVYMGSERVPVTTIDFTNSLTTMISFMSPVLVSGARTFVAYPTRLPANVATFTFTFIDR